SPGVRRRAAPDARHAAESGKMKRRSFARQLMSLASRLVPQWRRSEWIREWNAELDHFATTGRGPAQTLAHAIGAVADALWLRVHAVQFDLWWGDFRFACRHAARRPAFALLGAGTIALALGAGSAVFAMVDAVLLRPLGYKDPSRLVFVWHTLP